MTVIVMCDVCHRHFRLFGCQVRMLLNDSHATSNSRFSSSDESSSCFSLYSGVVCALAGHPDLVTSMVMNSPILWAVISGNITKTGRQEGRTWAMNDRAAGLKMWLNAIRWVMCQIFVRFFLVLHRARVKGRGRKRTELKMTGSERRI